MSIVPSTKPVFARLKPSMTREQIKRNLIAALEKSGFTIDPGPKQPDEAGVMTREPKIPMLPEELPQQRIHEVVDLPERPEPFDYCEINYGTLSSCKLPKNGPTNSTYLCQVEWAWSPAHNRLDAYYLHRGRTHWVLWSKYWDDNWMKWEQVAVGCVPRGGVDQKQAAVYLLLEFWSFDAKEGGVDEFHWINEDGYLSIAELAAIAREVWG